MELIQRADLHDLNIRVRKSAGMRRLGRMACIGENKSGTKFEDVGVDGRIILKGDLEV